jgi:hypothetical protein
MKIDNITTAEQARANVSEWKVGKEKEWNESALKRVVVIVQEIAIRSKHGMTTYKGFLGNLDEKAQKRVAEALSKPPYEFKVSKILKDPNYIHPYIEISWL